jgi:hypothetical protein
MYAGCVESHLVGCRRGGGNRGGGCDQCGGGGCDACGGGYDDACCNTGHDEGCCNDACCDDACCDDGCCDDGCGSCGGACWGDDCHRGRCKPWCLLGGCGEFYWNEWFNDPPDCCDPCDCCGNNINGMFTRRHAGPEYCDDYHGYGQGGYHGGGYQGEGTVIEGPAVQQNESNGPRETSHEARRPTRSALVPPQRPAPVPPQAMRNSRMPQTRGGRVPAHRNGQPTPAIGEEQVVEGSFKVVDDKIVGEPVGAGNVASGGEAPGHRDFAEPAPPGPKQSERTARKPAPKAKTSTLDRSI